MELLDRLTALIEPTLDAMGYDLVRVSLQGNRRLTLQIMAERRDDAAMSVDDCTAISHAVSALLDVEDPIDAAYTLEVSSPGIDRPLTRAKDFVAWAGFDAKLETREPIDGRRRFQGTLLGLSEDDRVRLVVEGVEHQVPRAALSKAKLMLTDALIAAVTRDTDDA